MIDDNLKILVLGASGLVGTNLLCNLSDRKNWQIYAMYNKNPIRFHAKNIIPVKACLLTKNNSIDKFFKNIDVIINLAGNVTRVGLSLSDELDSLKNTLDINLNIASTLGNICSNPKIIHISSVTGYPSFENREITNTMFDGDPVKNWFIKGWTYRYIEKIFEHCLLESFVSSLKIIRPSMIYGPHDLNEEKRFIPDLIKQRLNNFPAVPVNGVDKKNIIYVNDLCNDIISAIECQKKTDVLYCKNNIEVSVGELHFLCNALIKIIKDRNNCSTSEINVDDVVQNLKENSEFDFKLNNQHFHQLVVGLYETVKWFHQLNQKENIHGQV